MVETGSGQDEELIIILVRREW